MCVFHVCSFAELQARRDEAADLMAMAGVSDNVTASARDDDVIDVMLNGHTSGVSDEQV